MDLFPKEQLNKTCKDCEHRQRYQCGGRVIQYCGKQKSNRSENGLKKIMARDKACGVFLEKIKPTTTMKNVIKNVILVLVTFMLLNCKRDVTLEPLYKIKIDNNAYVLGKVTITYYDKYDIVLGEKVFLNVAPYALFYEVIPECHKLKFYVTNTKIIDCDVTFYKSGKEKETIFLPGRNDGGFLYNIFKL